MSVLSLSTYTVHVPARQLHLRERFIASRREARSRAALQAALAGDLGHAQRDELRILLGR